MAKKYKYDAFISYSHKDETWVVKTLLPRLEKVGLTVCIDFRDFDAGCPSLMNMENAVINSHYTVAVMTPNWVKSEWSDFEALLIKTLDPAGRHKRLIPIMLIECKPPLRISTLSWVDFTRKDREQIAWKRLFTALGKPDAPISTATSEEANPQTSQDRHLAHPYPMPPNFTGREAERKYKDRLKEPYSTMRVLFKAETVPLNDLYVDLFVLEEPEAFRRFGIDYLESGFEDTGGFFSRGERSSALRVVSQTDHLFVLGKPGAGKTTLLKHLTTLASEEIIDKVPIFISFNNWAVSQRELIEFIIEQFDIYGFPNAKSYIDVLFGKGNAILLFDGLDEVSEENNLRDRLIYDVEKLISRYPTNKFVITCRNAANEYQFDGFTYVEIADFSDKQVNIFVNKWFGDNSQTAQEFIKALADSKHQNLRELSHNPLLLGMLCLVYESTSNFPVKRGEVYQDAIDALLKRWDKQRGIQRDKIPGFSPEVESHLLSSLAYDYLLENKIFFEQTDLQSKTSRLLNQLLDGVVDSETIINTIEVQHGLLAKRAHRIYTFSHLTFQEYFTARYIIDQLNTTDKSLNELFRHFYNSRWREVFLLTSSLLPSADRFFEIFNSHIRNPVKKDKQVIHAISWSNSLTINLKKGNWPFKQTNGFYCISHFNRPDSWLSTDNYRKARSETCN